MKEQWWTRRVQRGDRIARVFILELLSVGWIVLLGIVPIVAIMIVGLIQGTMPDEADGGYTGEAPGYPAFTSLSAGLIVPALAMAATFFMTVTAPLRDWSGPRRLDLGGFSFVGGSVATVAASMDVEEPAWVVTTAVLAVLIFFTTALLYFIRSVAGWVRLVPRSWREETVRRKPSTRSRHTKVTTIKVEPSMAEDWVAIPDVWPWQGYRDGTEWGNFVARVFGDECGWNDDQRARCAEAMRALAEDGSDEEYRYAIIDENGEDVFVAIIMAQVTDEPLNLEMACGVEDPSIVRTLSRGEFETEGMLTGYRHHRLAEGGDGEQDGVAMLTYAFQHDGMAVVVHAAVADAADLVARVHNMDALAGAISVVEV